MAATTSPSPRLRVALLGAGNRGRIYADLIASRSDGQLAVVAIAEPRRPWREATATDHNVAPTGCFDSWERLIAAGVLDDVDAVVNTTPDDQHIASSLPVIDAGRPMLLEKPMANTAADVLRLATATEAPNTAPVWVAHVLRYTTFFRRVHELVRSGAVGDVMSVDHAETIAHWHFAHSYVRGNWARSGASSPMILAKCCHDLDVISWIVDEPFETAASVGSLGSFTEFHEPDGATDRCTDGCGVIDCLFDARPFYGRDGHGWPLNVLTLEPTAAARLDALANSPYGRCVFRCDNDVPDRQASIFTTPSGITVSLSITGNSHTEGRRLRIDGTRGTIVARFDHVDPSIEVMTHGDRATRREVIDLSGGHGGGDSGIVETMVDALVTGATPPSSTVASAVPSHLAALAAEHARLSATVVNIDEFAASAK